MDNQCKRREFLRKAALLTASMFTLSEIGLGSTLLTDGHCRPLLNPAFRIKKNTNGELELFTFQQDKTKLNERFAGLDADVISIIVNEENPKDMIKSLAFKYNLSIPECEEKINNLLFDLKDSGIIYYGEKMLVKIQEA